MAHTRPVRHPVPVPDTAIAIGPAAVSDAGVIYAIKMRAFAEEGRLSGSMDLPPLLEDVSSIELDIRTHTVLIARDGEQIVGSARGVVAGVACQIRAVCVEPSWQGRGIGAALLRAVETAHPDVARFELTTNTLVPGNVEFYERHGYHVVELESFGDRITLAHLSKSASVSES